MQLEMEANLPRSGTISATEFKKYVRVVAHPETNHDEDLDVCCCICAVYTCV